MERGTELYQGFIDGLVKMRGCAEAAWVLRGSYPERAENEKVNRLLAKCGPEERKLLSEMLQKTYDGGIHDTLAYMDERIGCERLTLLEKGVEYRTEEFESMHFDFVCRKEGDAWPEQTEE